MRTIKSLAMIFGLSLISQGALAAAMKKTSSASSSSSGGSKSGGRDWLISLPVIAERPQFRIHAEYNAARIVGLAIEAATIATVEELGEDEIVATGNSLTINGAQASLLMSRYSDEANMGGFFWSTGVGYRRWNAEWKKKPDAV